MRVNFTVVTTRWVVYSWAGVKTVNSREAVGSSQTHLVEPSHRSVAVCRQINSTQIKCTHTHLLYFLCECWNPELNLKLRCWNKCHFSRCALQLVQQAPPHPTSPHLQVTRVCRVTYSFTYGSALLNEYEIKGGFVEDYHYKIPDLCMSARGRCWSAHADRHKLWMHDRFLQKKKEKKKRFFFLNCKMLQNTIVLWWR